MVKCGKCKGRHGAARFVRACYAGDRCSWLVERPTNHPEPDSRADAFYEVECGAPLVFKGEGWECDGGHAYAGLEAELGPYGAEWEREQYDRMGVFA